MRIRDRIALMIPERIEVRLEDFLNKVIRRALCTRVLTMPYRIYSDVSSLLREYDAQFARNNNVLEDDECFAGEYINVLIETGNQEKARHVLNLLSEDKRLQCSARYFRVAQLSQSCGIATDAEARVADVFRRMCENHVSNFLINYFTNKSVAVVGNGPSEVGKGLGQEIDSHDIVVRINNYAIDGYEKDYGTKTDVWVKASLDFIKHGIRDERIKAIIYESNLERYSLHDGFVDAMDSELKSRFVDYCGQSDHAFFCERYYRYPTTGLMIINKLGHLPIKSLDVYGFSFLQEKINRTGSFEHYSKADSLKVRELNRRWHQMDYELAFFNKLFPNKTRRLVLG